MVKLAVKCASLIMVCVLIFNIFLINVSAENIADFDFFVVKYKII